MRRTLILAGLLVLSVACSNSGEESANNPQKFSAAIFVDPPIAFAPQTRWWWPGGAVDDATLRSQLQTFVEVGYGAIEIQPFMATLTDADILADARVRSVGDDAFLQRLRTAACEATELGLPWDLTLGSGWSTGGIGIEDDGARQLIMTELTLAGPMRYDGAIPAPEPPGWIDGTNGVLQAIDGFDDNASLVAVLAARVLDEAPGTSTLLGDIVDLGPLADQDTLTWDVPAGSHRVFAIYENRTRHFPAGNAYPGTLRDARVIDHLDRRGVDAFLNTEFEAWMDAVSDCPPRAVFVDSFELVGELPWTTAFQTKFQAANGYDIDPFLPFVFLLGGESEYVNILTGALPNRNRNDAGSGLRAREDYERFRSQLFAQEFIVPLQTWLRDRGVDLRLQAHGGYADALDAYAMADVPESEGLYAGGSHDFLRLSASAAHVSGKRYISSETFVSVGTAQLTEDEARLLMGRAFGAGINRIMHHGNSYPYRHQDDQRWFPFHPVPGSAFSAGPLDLSFDIHPQSEIWPALPDLNAWARRMGYAMSRGEPVADVAWLYADWHIENFPNFGVEPGAFESELSTSLRQAGFAYDRVSRAMLGSATAENGALQIGQGAYRALIVEAQTAMDPALLQAIERSVQAGVPVVWVGDFPQRADGLVDAASRDAAVTASVASLQSSVRRVASVDALTQALRSAGVEPAVAPTDAAGLRLSVQQRRVSDGHVYFLFNESYETLTESVQIRTPFNDLVALDPDTGQQLAITIDGSTVTVTLNGPRGVVLWAPDA